MFSNNSIQIIRTLAVLGSIAIAITSLGFGCGLGFEPISSRDQGSFSSNTPDIPPSAPAEPIEIVVGKRTVGLPIHTATYASMLSALQVPTPSAQTLQELGRQSGSLSENGSALSINSPVMFSAIALGASICLDRINLEKPMATDQRLFFNSVNFTQGPAQTLTDANTSTVINRLARALWQRNETAAERTQLIAATNQIATAANTAATQPQRTEQAILGLCTTMAASTSALAF